MRPTLAVSMLLSATLTGGCASVQQNADVPSLDGTAWVLSELPGRTLVAGATATASFQAGRVAGSDGCNRYTAGYTATGGTLAITSPASTMMACAPEVMQQADAFTRALTGATRYRSAGERLELLGANGEVLATLARQSQELAGTSWRATGINNGKGGVVSVAAGTTVTLSFGADGRAAGSAGCNRFTAGYEASGPSLRFSPAASTRRMCVEEGVMEQEAAFLAALGTVATARLEGDRLELRTADGALAASFVRDAGT